MLDTQWYAGIALHGYHWSVDGKPAVAFYPLYPLLIHIVSTWGAPGVAAGMLLANAACLTALFYLRAWVAEIAGGAAATRAVWLITFLPTAFFFFAPYSESLALLCSLAAFYHARHGQGVIAGLWTAAAILTRPTGLILIPAILAYLVFDWRTRRTGDAWPRWASLAGALLPSAVSGLVYLWYLHAQRIPLDALLSAQRYWHRSLTYPWTGFTSSIHWLAHHATVNPGWTTENVLQLTVTVAFLALTIFAWRELDAASRAYCAGFWLIVLVSPEWRDGYFAPFSSMDRFVLLLFPLFAWIAVRARPTHLRLALPLGGAVAIGATCVHLLGGWVG